MPLGGALPATFRGTRKTSCCQTGAEARSRGPRQRRRIRSIQRSSAFSSFLHVIYSRIPHTQLQAHGRARRHRHLRVAPLARPAGPARRCSRPRPPPGPIQFVSILRLSFLSWYDITAISPAGTSTASETSLLDACGEPLKVVRAGLVGPGRRRGVDPHEHVPGGAVDVVDRQLQGDEHRRAGGRRRRPRRRRRRARRRRRQLRIADGNRRREVRRRRQRRRRARRQRWRRGLKSSAEASVSGARRICREPGEHAADEAAAPDPADDRRGAGRRRRRRRGPRGCARRRRLGRLHIRSSAVD